MLNYIPLVRWVSLLDRYRMRRDELNNKTCIHPLTCVSDWRSASPVFGRPEKSDSILVRKDPLKTDQALISEKEGQLH